MAITVAQLRTFMAVARAGSIKLAAAELVVTQPSVSSSIAALEREIGAKVVERQGRGIRLSQAGEAFLPFASQVLGLLEDGRAAAVEAANPERQELRIAAVNTAGEHILPPVLHAFRRRYPKIEVYLEISNRARVFRQVELRDADIGIGGSPPESGELDGVPFLDNRLVVISSPEDPLASRRRLHFGDLEEATWLLREPGSGTRIFTRRLLDEKGIKPPTMTIGSNGAIKQSVRAGLGISLQSERAVALELAMGMLSRLDLAEEIRRREWYALYPGQGPRRSVVDTFLGFLTGTAAREAIDDSLSAPLEGT